MAEYLPPSLSADLINELVQSLGLSQPTSVKPLQVTAAFHSIYLLHFSATAAQSIAARSEPDGSIILVLRVSGRHLPRIKTLNEVGVMTWVRQNTSIPVPAVIRFDACEDNVIGHEFTILEKAPGISVDKVYDSLTEETKRYMVQQLTDYLIQLHSKSWKNGYVGGLVVQNGALANGPPIDDNFWMLPDIRKYWSDDETLETLNPITTPCTSWTSHAAACIERAIHAIQTHPTLIPFRDLVPRLIAFITAVHSPLHASALNDVKYIVAHKDLHFANIMCEPVTGLITSILDWEFAGVVPAPRWNPPKAFLWNGQPLAESRVERTRMERVFEEVCLERGAGWLLEQVRMNTKQEALQKVVGHTRAIVEVCPRGQGGEKVLEWRGVVEEGLAAFGV